MNYLILWRIQMAKRTIRANVDFKGKKRGKPRQSKKNKYGIRGSGRKN